MTRKLLLICKLCLNKKWMNEKMNNTNYLNNFYLLNLLDGFDFPARKKMSPRGAFGISCPCFHWAIRAYFLKCSDACIKPRGAKSKPMGALFLPSWSHTDASVISTFLTMMGGERANVRKMMTRCASRWFSPGCYVTEIWLVGGDNGFAWGEGVYAAPVCPLPSPLPH